MGAYMVNSKPALMRSIRWNFGLNAELRKALNIVIAIVQLHRYRDAHIGVYHEEGYFPSFSLSTLLCFVDVRRQEQYQEGTMLRNAVSDKGIPKTIMLPVILMQKIPKPPDSNYLHSNL